MVFVWTDFGGVLTPPISTSMQAFCSNQGITFADLQAALQRVGKRHGVDDPMALIDTSIMTEREWLAELSAELQGAFHLDTLADVWFDNRPPNRDWIKQLRMLRANGIGVGMISNMVPTWDAHWRRMLGEVDIFEHIVLSFEVGHRKPEKEIFHHAAKLAGIPPSDCILIDDLDVNCSGARAAGWKAMEFKTAEAAAKSLRELLEHS